MHHKSMEEIALSYHPLRKVKGYWGNDSALQRG